MLKFVTDRRPGEPDILAGLEHENLIIKNIEGHPILILAASEPWTHESLTGLDLDQMLGETLDFGASAYLGDTWIGSTEI